MADQYRAELKNLRRVAAVLLRDRAGEAGVSDGAMVSSSRVVSFSHSSRPCRGDHLAHKASEATDVPAGIDGVAEPYDYEVLRRQDDDALAEVAGCEERIVGDPELNASFRVGVLATIGPEPRGVI